MRRWGLAICIIWSVCATARAEMAVDAPETGERSPGMIIRAITIDDLRSLADALEADIIDSGFQETSGPYIVATLPSTLTFGAYAVCAPPEMTDCRGVEVVSVFQSPAPLESIAAADMAFAAVSVQKTSDETVNVTRYVILDHGVTWANLIENVRVFELLCHHVAERLSGPEAPPAP